MGTNQDLNPANQVQGSSYLYKFGTTPNTRTAVSQKVKILAPQYGGTDGTLNQVGVLSAFTPQESRNIEPVRGIGFGDIIAELVPSVTEPMTADIERALLYLSNLWQAFGYAAGVSGPARSLRHHRWPFDVEMQMAFSQLTDMDLGVEKGAPGPVTGTFQSGISRTTYPVATTPQINPYGSTDLGNSALITIYEACWFNSYNISNIAKDAGMLMESGSVTITDVHDVASQYGEFLPTGNDPTIGQTASKRFPVVRPIGAT